MFTSGVFNCIMSMCRIWVVTSGGLVFSIKSIRHIILDEIT